MEPAATLPEAVPLKRCGCLGVRSCALCVDPSLREAHGLFPARAELPVAGRVGELRFSMAGPMVDFGDGATCGVADLPVPFDGFELVTDIVDAQEEAEILRDVEAWPWHPSQSGRWKQDFGPKANFKRQQVKVPDDWVGIPGYAHGLLSRLREQFKGLEDFVAAEFLNLRYHRDLNSSHALHIDDTWLWGERILGVSLGASSVFTFYEPTSNVIVRAPLPQRSAYVLRGRVRYDWQHGILAEDIRDMRVAMTFRELEPAIGATDKGLLAAVRAQGVAEPPSRTSACAAPSA